ncbi:type III secretion system domain-containing protein [Aeromonas veronii]
MNPSLQALYRLWHTPGQVMHPGWWKSSGLSQWSFTYERYPLTRQALNHLLRQSLALDGKPPALTTLTQELIIKERGEPLLIALGLYAMQARTLLMLRPYREILSTRFDSLAFEQLKVILPSVSQSIELAPIELPERALRIGSAWISIASDPALRACRLLFPPSDLQSPEECPVPVLQKIVRWL